MHINDIRITVAACINQGPVAWGICYCKDERQKKMKRLPKSVNIKQVEKKPNIRENVLDVKYVCCIGRARLAINLPPPPHLLPESDDSHQTMVHSALRAVVDAIERHSVQVHSPR